MCPVVVVFDYGGISLFQVCVNIIFSFKSIQTVNEVKSSYVLSNQHIPSLLFRLEQSEEACRGVQRRAGRPDSVGLRGRRKEPAFVKTGEPLRACTLGTDMI